MIVTSQTVNNLRTSVRAEFKTAIDAAKPESLANKLATLVPSGTKTNTYGWLGKFPQFREWIGDRVLKDIAESAYILENKKYEATLEVDRTDIEDDNLGQYRILAQSLGQEANDFKDRSIASLLIHGFTSPCYDGQNFFDEEHPVYKQTAPKETDTPTPISNIVGAGSGVPWFVLSLNRPLRPLLIQERMKMELEEIKDPQNDTVFMKDKYLYGGRWRGNFGYGLWQQAIASKDTLNAVNFEKALSTMEGFKRDGGDPLGITATHLVVPSSLRSAAENIVKRQNLANGESNINFGKVELIVSPWLS